jgi:glutamate/tyrosine decarboxylase-like PLP-dependent enzyme
MEYQVKTNHPHFHNQLFGGFDQYATIGNILSNTINSAMYTYEMAPVFSIMENEIYDHLRQLIGWDTVDGMMTPGGSFSNWMGMEMARHFKFP